MGSIPVSVLVVTKNEAKNIARCLEALEDFSQVIVIDSYSTDRTCNIAREYGAEVVLFDWNGKYPKKRQWALSGVNIGYNWVFWVDADEVVTPELVQEIHKIFACGEPRKSGYFVKGRYV